MLLSACRDLELDNILICKVRKGPFYQQVAKIAVFGVDINTAESPALTHCGTIEYAGTILWLAFLYDAR